MLAAVMATILLVAALSQGPFKWTSDSKWNVVVFHRVFPISEISFSLIFFYESLSASLLDEQDFLCSNLICKPLSKSL